MKFLNVHHRSESFLYRLIWGSMFILSFSHILFSQSVEQDSSPVRIPITGGIGGADHRFGVSVNVAYPINFQTVSLECLYLAEITSPMPVVPTPKQSRDFELSLLYGVGIEGRAGLISISSGVSIVNSIHYSRHNGERVVFTGIPFRIQILLGSGKYLRAGVTYFSNVNKYSSYDGALFTVRGVIL